MFNSRALGIRIEQYRKKINLSQKELGRKAGMSQSAISTLETGKTNLNIAKLSKIACVLGVSFDNLLSDSLNCFCKEIITVPEKLELINATLDLNENQLKVFNEILSDFIEYKNELIRQK